MTYKSYSLAFEQNGVIVAGQGTGTLKLDEAAGKAILDFGSESLPLLVAVPAIAHTNLLGGFSKVSVVDGEDETSTHQITVTGMAVGDEVVAVIVLSTKASIATAALHAGTLTAAAGKITPGTEVDNTGKQYLVFWNDIT